MKNFRMTKLAAAIGAATMSLALAPSANAVVVVGGDNGWEVSFDGNVNAFYTHFNNDNTKTTVTQNGGVTATASAAGIDGSRVHSGFLPAFFSFNVKSPTVNGLTGTARFSFAPTINTNQTGNGLGGTGGLTGATIDTREVLANVEGSFGTISFGRTLSLYGRQAILHDMTLFGVGEGGASSFGSVTAGRIGYGYLYPDFEARFAYATPNINGFKAEVGAYDPFLPTALGAAGNAFGVAGWQTDTPRFEGELTYSTTFTNGSLLAWADGMWQSLQGTTAATADTDISGVGGGAQLTYMDFGFTGYYQWNSGTSLGVFKVLAPGAIGAVGTAAGTGAAGGNLTCGNVNGAATASCDAADQNEWYVQGTYTFNGKTKVGISYGEANQDNTTQNFNAAGVATNLGHPDISNDMWSVGVYHDMTPWLKLIAEYNNVSNEAKTSDFNGATNVTTSTKVTGGYQTFSVGAFMTW